MIEEISGPDANRVSFPINALWIGTPNFRGNTCLHYRHFWQQNQGNPYDEEGHAPIHC
jgi:hypothetical protein